MYVCVLLLIHSFTHYFFHYLSSFIKQDWLKTMHLSGNGAKYSPYVLFIIIHTNLNITSTDCVGLNKILYTIIATGSFERF